MSLWKGVLVILYKISLEEAERILKENIKSLGEEEVHISKGINRVLSEDVVSTMDNPPFNKSPYDGYALNSADTIKASSLSKVKLKVIEDIYAGDWPTKEVTSGCVARIMTGAPIPFGADSVIMQEKVKVEGDSILIDRVVKSNENICEKGEDIQKGNILVQKGKTLNYADLGIIASIGMDKINVYKTPIITIVNTGDEVVDVGEKLLKGKIYNSNAYLLQGRLIELGCNIASVIYVDDSIEEIKKSLLKALEVSDLIITTGGVSVGDKDFLNEVIKEIGGEKLFWKVKIKPGSAMMCSRVDEKIILSLSGNPTAALTTFELLGRVILYALEPKEAFKLVRKECVLKNEFKKKSKVRRFIRGNINYINNGNEVCITQVKSGNGILSSLVNSNCLIDIEEGNEGLINGNKVNVVIL
ncbi:MAG: molybdopterin molybdotransferase MoeA [Sarcina sp.]